MDAAESLELLVEVAGHEVRTAYDRPTALEIAFEFRPNVVLLDIGLPDIDGYEVAKRLRQQPALSGVALVARRSARPVRREGGLKPMSPPYPYLAARKIVKSGRLRLRRSYTLNLCRGDPSGLTARGSDL